MIEKLAAKKRKKRPAKAARRGRPTRREASAKALKNVDAGAVDPRQVLQQVAADPSAPASARVAAARALMNDVGAGAGGHRAPAAPADAIALRALKILQGGNRK